jgi:hypothetical protein
VVPPAGDHSISLLPRRNPRVLLRAEHRDARPVGRGTDRHKDDRFDVLFLPVINAITIGLLERSPRLVTSARASRVQAQQAEKAVEMLRARGDCPGPQSFWLLRAACR